MALKQLSLSLQFGELKNAARHRAALPRHSVARWIRHALAQDGEITVRIVDAEEGQALNRDYRQRDYATNVLTFDYTQETRGDRRPGAVRAGGCPGSERQRQDAAGPLRPPAGARHLARQGLGP